MATFTLVFLGVLAVAIGLPVVVRLMTDMWDFQTSGMTQLSKRIMALEQDIALLKRLAGVEDVQGDNGRFFSAEEVENTAKRHEAQDM